MAKKQTGGTEDFIPVPRDNYNDMVAVMLEIAFRGQKEEAAMMRVANAGGIPAVTAEIKRRRLYAKKQGMVRASAADVDDTEAPAPPKGKKKTTRKRKPRAQADNPPPPPADDNPPPPPADDNPPPHVGHGG